MEYFENIEKLLTDIWNRQDQNLKPFYKAKAVYDYVSNLTPDELSSQMHNTIFNKQMLWREVEQAAYSMMWDCQQAEFLR